MRLPIVADVRSSSLDTSRVKNKWTNGSKRWLLSGAYLRMSLKDFASMGMLLSSIRFRINASQLWKLNDAAVVAHPDDVSVRSSTRFSDFVNHGRAFDEIYVYGPLLASCCEIIGIQAQYNACKDNRTRYSAGTAACGF